jgi:hypothetical protein
MLVELAVVAATSGFAAAGFVAVLRKSSTLPRSWVPAGAVPLAAAFAERSENSAFLEKTVAAEVLRRLSFLFKTKNQNTFS